MSKGEDFGIISWGSQVVLKVDPPTFCEKQFLKNRCKSSKPFHILHKISSPLIALLVHGRLFLCPWNGQLLHCCASKIATFHGKIPFFWSLDQNNHCTVHGSWCYPAMFGKSIAQKWPRLGLKVISGIITNTCRFASCQNSIALFKNCFLHNFMAFLSSLFHPHWSMVLNDGSTEYHINRMASYVIVKPWTPPPCLFLDSGKLFFVRTFLSVLSHCQSHYQKMCSAHHVTVWCMTFCTKTDTLVFGKAHGNGLSKMHDERVLAHMHRGWFDTIGSDNVTLQCVVFT